MLPALAPRAPRRRTYRVLRSFLLLALLGPAICAAQSEGCLNGSGDQTRRLPSGYVLTISPSGEARRPCSVELADSAGKVTYAAAGYAIRLLGPGKGGAGLVVEQVSAAHSYKYAFFSLDPPRLGVRLSNSFPFTLHSSADRTVLRTSEGAFGALGLAPEFAPRADLFLEFDGHRLRDASASYRREYDHAIAQARQRLWARDLQALRDNGPLDQPEMRQAILTIVGEYLYSGREKQAWQALEDMWPPVDREHIRRQILDARARGLLSQIAPANAP